MKHLKSKMSNTSNLTNVLQHGPRKNPKTLKLNLPLRMIMEIVHFLLDNLYVQYMGSILRQLFGEPLGTDCATDLTNLFLLCSNTNIL